MVTDGNMAKVEKYFEENPTASQRRASQQLGISRSSLQRLMKTLDFFSYKIQLSQPISTNTAERRVEFCNKMLAQHEWQEIDFSKIWFTDEAHFHLEGYVNKQNMRYWGKQNPEITMVKPLHPARITVWCAINGEMILGPYFITTTVSGAVYHDLLKNQVFPEMNRLGKVRGYYFMQDGARPHRTEQVFELLEQQFGSRLIGLDSEKYTGSGIEWPAYSPDLNPCDFFLWGFLKDNVYRSGPNSPNDLKAAVQAKIGEIGTDILERVVEGFENRLRYCLTTEGKHFEKIFH